MHITFERLGFEALATSLMFKLVVFTKKYVAEGTLENTATCTLVTSMRISGFICSCEPIIK